MRWALCSLAFVAACATAGKATDKPIDASSGDDDDTDAPVPIDAPAPIDAPVMATLSETINSTMVYGNSIGCSNGNNTMSDNEWYRGYALADFGITGVFHAQQVVFSVQETAGAVTVTVKIGTYTGDIDAATVDTSKFALLGTAQTVVPPNTSGQTGENVTVPYVADIPAGSKFIVELSVPQQSGNNHYMFPGATTAGEHHPGYWQASDPACTNNAIETTVAASSTGQLIINVVGEH
jgi:hypothetical protein